MGIGCGTDEPDDNRFILVRGRRKYKAEKVYEAVSTVPVDMSGNEWTGEKTLVNEKQMKNSKDASRAHSLEIIPLIE